MRPFIDVHGPERSFRVHVNRTARARRMTLRVASRDGTIVLTAPPHVGLASLDAFVARHVDWMAGRLGALSPSVGLQVGATIPFRGVPTMIVAGGLRAVASLKRSEGAAPAIEVGGPPSRHRASILEFVKAEAMVDLTKAVARHARAAGRSMPPIALKDTRSRWGSCSAKGALNFSWRLVFAPPFVLDYLAAHEVAHLVHMNHSSAYWAVVKKLLPDYRQAEAWLQAHGSTLHLYR